MSHDPADTQQRREIAPEKRDRVVQLHQTGYGTRKIARAVGLNRKTVQRLLSETAPAPDDRQSTAASKLDPFLEAVRQKVDLGLTTTRILREIRAQGYAGGRTILAQLCRSLRAQTAGRRRPKRRFETPPGKEMQIDWSPYRVKLGGRQQIVHAFSMVLCYARKKHVRFYLNEREATLLEAHLHAFADFGGVAEMLVYDRMATVVLGQIGRDGDPIWHPRFLDFKTYYGFDPFLCKRADPNRKGKVERPFHHLEQDFLHGSEFSSLADLNARARWWLDNIANGKPHGTTGRVPDEAFLEEQPLLTRLPDVPYAGGCDEEARRVDDDATISVCGTRYSIPSELVAGATVTVRLYAEEFSVLDAAGREVMRRPYVAPADKGVLQIDPAHYDGAASRAPAFANAKIEERFVLRFPTLLPLVEGLKRRMKSLAHIHVRALLRLAAQYGADPFHAAAERAQSYRRFDAHAVRRILERDHPLPPEEPPHSLTAASRVNLLLGEVDGGSLDSFADLDTWSDSDGLLAAEADDGKA